MCALSRLCLTCLVCGFLPGWVQAGTITVDAAGKPLPAGPLAVAGTTSRVPSIPAQVRVVEGHQLRCWQHGKLIIDEFRPGPANAAPDTLDLQPLPSTTAHKGAVLDGRTTTCLLKPQSRAAANSQPAAGPPALPFNPPATIAAP